MANTKKKTKKALVPKSTAKLKGGLKEYWDKKKAVSKKKTKK